MPRIVTFADGFSSASAPDIEGSIQENYTLTNNISSATNINGLVFDSAETITAFGSFELTRGTYHQAGSAMFICDAGVWSISLGNFDGDSILNDALDNTYNVVLSFGTAGQVQYTSGNLAGSPTTILKLVITRIRV